LVRAVAQPQHALAYSPQLPSSQQYQQAHQQPTRFPPPQAPAQVFPPRAVTSPLLPDRQYHVPPLLSAPPLPVLPSAGPFDPRQLSVQSAETLPPWQPTPLDASVVGWPHGQPPSAAPASFGERATAPFVPPRRALASPTGVEGGAEAAEMGGAESTVSASVDSAAAVDIVGGAVSALMLLGDYLKALLEEAGADQVA
ncbi:hypothetical protein CLOP_g25297, partial [Closterium sp. NIES-67]